MKIAFVLSNYPGILAGFVDRYGGNHSSHLCGSDWPFLEGEDRPRDPFDREVSA
jgi:hypothetical protein